VDEAALKAAFEARKGDTTEFKARHILFKAEGDASSRKPRPRPSCSASVS